MVNATTGSTAYRISYSTSVIAGSAVGSNQDSSTYYPTGRETIALPMYPELTDEMLSHVVGSIGEFFEGRAILPFERKRDVA